MPSRSQNLFYLRELNLERRVKTKKKKTPHSRAQARLGSNLINMASLSFYQPSRTVFARNSRAARPKKVIPRNCNSFVGFAYFAICDNESHVEFMSLESPCTTKNITPPFLYSYLCVLS